MITLQQKHLRVVKYKFKEQSTEVFHHFFGIDVLPEKVEFNLGWDFPKKYDNTKSMCKYVEDENQKELRIIDHWFKLGAEESNGIK
jgi:hypothetical protein